MGKYFGTDGIRREANRELTVDKALRLGYALGYYLKNNNPNDEKIKVIMGRACAEIGRASCRERV